MSWSDDEIDGLFREAGQKITVPPYQDAFFDEFEKLLPKRKKRLFGLWWVFAGFAVSGLGITLYYTNDFNSKPQIAFKKDAKQVLLERKELNWNKDNISEILSGSEKTDKNDVKNTGNNFRTKRNAARKVEEIQFYVKTSDSTLGLAEMPLDTKDPKVKTGLLNYNSLVLPLFPSPSGKLGIRGMQKEVKAKRFYLQLGFATSDAYLIPQSKSSPPMYAIVAEGGYQFQKRNWAVGLGMRYQWTMVNDLTLTRASKVYGFNVDYYGQVVEYKSIGSFEFPIQLSYIKGNHRFGIAATPTINAGANLTITKTKNEQTTEKTDYTFNKFGMNTFGFKPEISYQVKLRPYLELGINLAIQTINPLEKDKFAGQLNSNTFIGQLHIRKFLGFK